MSHPILSPLSPSPVRDHQLAINRRQLFRNSALTEFAYTPRRHMLFSYNHLPHLDAPERRDWVTYS